MESAEGTPTPEATPTLFNFNYGDILDVLAGPIYDHNGHIVPDGTIVRFILSQEGEFGTNRQVEALTIQGNARATVRIDSTGNLEIRAESEEALTSDVIQILVPNADIIETKFPSETPEPSSTVEVASTSLDSTLEPAPNRNC
jgi:beta-N-acetylhexosaminidase